MVQKKKKLKKKEIKEDQLVTSFYKAQEYFETNKQKILISVGAIAIIILAITGILIRK